VADDVINFYYKIAMLARQRWLTPIILATQEAEIRRITVQCQPREKVHKTPSQKKLTKKCWWNDLR
jgi:hypothetical protein